MQVEEIEKLGFPKQYSEFLTNAFCELALVSVEKDDYEAVMTLGWQGRVLVDEHPSLALIIVETLGKALEKVNEGRGLEKLSSQNIKIEIESIQKFNKNNHKEIKEKVDELLK
jgi:hypothetical protein